MKKLIAILIAGIMLLALAACNGANNNNTNNNAFGDTAGQTNGQKAEASTGAGVDLKYDFTHMNDKNYHAHIKLATDDEVTEYDEDEPNFVRIENEAKNYVVDLTLDIESKDAYTQFQESAKAENEIYKETSFGKYPGYYSDDDGIYGYILLDDSDEIFNVFVSFYVYLFDEIAANDNYLSIYESPQVQSILNNIEFESSK